MAQKVNLVIRKDGRRYVAIFIWPESDIPKEWKIIFKLSCKLSAEAIEKMKANAKKEAKKLGMDVKNLD